MQQRCVFVFISIISFFLVLVMTLVIYTVVSEIKMEKTFNQFIKEMENEIEYNKRLVDINNIKRRIKDETNN